MSGKRGPGQLRNGAGQDQPGTPSRSYEQHGYVGSGVPAQASGRLRKHLRADQLSALPA